MEPLRRVTEKAVPAPWTIARGDSPVIAVALHQGHDLRAEVADLVGVDAGERRREEDPWTGWLTQMVPSRVVVHRSRFEFDLNRPLEEAVATDPADSWGLKIWKQRPPQHVLDGSRYLHAAFYSALRRLFGDVERKYGRFVVLDIHSFNHRRNGPDAEPADQASHPDVNVGTGSLDRDRWGPLVDRFMDDIGAHPLGLDVRENVKFKGRHLAAWTHSEFKGKGCCLALEFKKTFMDEWTGEVDEGRLESIADALTSTLPGLHEELFA